MTQHASWPRIAARVLIVLTDVGLAFYWILTAVGVVSIGRTGVLATWNWSFLPLDILAVVLGWLWAMLPQNHALAMPAFVAALSFTFAAGLMAVSYFALDGTWDGTWWLVNIWLMVVPILGALAYGLPVGGIARDGVGS